MNRFILLALAILVTLPLSGQDNGGETARKANLPSGYQNITWGTALSNTRDTIKGKLVYTDEKSVIISSDGELEYHYGFFYRDPEEMEEDGDKKGQDEGKLFYVALKFPYLSMEEVKKKIVDKYGPSTNENLSDNQGAIAWNGEKTVIIMWVDEYEDKPYCRRITYLSKDIAKEVKDYRNTMFNETEIEIIKKLTL